MYGKHKVIKLYRNANEANCADLEFNNSMILWNLGILTPKPYERIDVNNRPGIIFEFVEGKEFSNELLSDPSYRSRKMAQFLFDFNKNKISDLSLLKGLRTLETNFRINLEKPSLLLPHEKSEILRRFLKLSHTYNLYHGDFNPTNLIISNNKLYIIDNVSLSIGNPLADVMEMILIWKYKVIPDRFSRDFIKKFYKNRQIILTNFIDEYIRLSGISYSDLQEWFLPVASTQISNSNNDPKENEIIARDIRLELLKSGSISLTECADIF